MEKNNYYKLAAAHIISFIIMYSVMFSNVNDTSNIYLSLNRLYMTLLMVAPMAIVMLGIMSSMFKNKMLNSLIVGSSLIIMAAAFILLRSQTFIQDKEFMYAMIPHHASAILVSGEAEINDPELKELTKQIIESQKKEIAQMKSIIARLENDSKRN